MGECRWAACFSLEPKGEKEAAGEEGEGDFLTLYGVVWCGVGQNRSMGEERGSLEWKKRGVCRKEEGGGGGWVVLVGGERGQEEHQK